MNVAEKRPLVHSGTRFLAGAMCVIMAAATKAPAQSLEIRSPCAVWVVRNALGTPRAWKEAIGAVERTGCRRIYLQVSGRWDAYYPSRVFTPPAVPPFGASWEDPFGIAIAEARARGIEVHAWVNAMLAWSAPDPPRDLSHVYHRHPEWFVADRSGRSMRDLSRAELDRQGLVGEGWFLDPASLGVRTELRRFLLELSLAYPIDGIHLDYIRYPAGWASSESAGTISYLLALIRQDLERVRPNAVLSAAVLPVPDVAERTFGQAWVDWVGQGIVDEVVPMVYRENVRSVLEVVNDYPTDLSLERVWVGLRVDRLNPPETNELGDRLRDLGIAGTALFSQNLLNELDSWRRD